MKIKYLDLLHVIGQITRQYLTSHKFHLDNENDKVIIDTPRQLCEFVIDVCKELDIEITL